MPTKAIATARRIDPQERAEAFAAWERYRDRFAQYLGETMDLPDDVLQQRPENPFHALLFADGYLAGKRAAVRQMDDSTPSVATSDAVVRLQGRSAAQRVRRTARPEREGA